MKKLITLSLTILVLSAGCKKDKGDPPVLPPEESMIIDFSNFESLKKSAGIDEIKGTENTCWEFAADAVRIWRSYASLTLIVPITAFQMVVDRNPEYVSEKTWQWSHTGPIGQATYKARLTGQIKKSNVEWKMYITKEGTDGFTDFLWFEGNSAFDGKTGNWTFYHSNTNPVSVIEIDWERAAADQGKIKYTYVKDDDFQGSYIEHGRTSGTRDAYFKIHYWNDVKFSDVDIEWSTKSRFGRVKSIDYMGDDQWHCWDGNKVNTDCPD